MEDIARIGFQVDSKGLVEGKKRLEDILPPAKKLADTSDELAKKMNWVKDATGRWRDEFGRFVPQARLAEVGIENTTKKVGIFGSLISKTTGILGSFGGGMVAAMGIGAATFGLSAMVGTLSNFEYQMSAVAAVSGATGAVLESLRDTAKELGATTEFSASQAAAGLKLLVQAGYSAEDAIATLPAVLNLATTEAMDLGVATEYVNSIMAGFGLGVQDAARVTDVLVYASNAASTGVAELGEGMKYVAPIAAALGISIEDTAAAMGILSDAGLKGSQAGTSLRGSLAALGNPSSTAADEINRLGLTLGELNPQVNSIIEIVDRLADAGLDASGAFKIFGTEAAPAMLALIANREKLKSLTGEMSNVAGEAQRVADYMRDNLKGSLQGLLSVVEGVIIAMGEAGLTAVLRAVMDGATVLLGGVIMLINGFSSLFNTLANPIFDWVVENQNALIAAVLGVAVAITASYVPAVVSAISYGATWAATFFVINGGFVGMTAAIYTTVAALVTLRGALLATGIGGIAVAAGLAIKAVLDLADEIGGLGAVWEFAKRVASAVLSNMGDQAAAFGMRAKAVWLEVQASFMSMIASLQTAWGQFLTGVAADLRTRNLYKVPGIDATVDALDEAGWAAQQAGGELENSLSGIRAEAEKTGAAATKAFGEIAAVDYDQLKTDARLAAMGLGEVNANVVATGTAATNAVTPIDNLDDIITDLGDSSGGKGGAAGKVEELKTALQSLTEEFQKLTEPFDQASAAFDALDKAKELGVISNDAFVASLGRIEQAFLASGGSAEQWAKIIGKGTETVAEQLDELGKKNVTELGGAFADLAVDGKASFEDLAKSIIKDLLAIAWQALAVKPLLNMMGIPFAKGGAFGGDALSGAPVKFAKGGAFTNQIFTQPTPFKFARGGGFGLGEMGEAGPEAVMPLTRGPDGSLGVQMYGEAANGAVRASGGAAVVRLHVIGEEGPMFRPTIRAEAEGVSVEVTGQAVNQMNEQLPSRVDEILQDPRMR